jgi:hypothetical protein
MASKKVMKSNHFSKQPNMWDCGRGSWHWLRSAARWRRWRLAGASPKSSYSPPFSNLRAWLERGGEGIWFWGFLWGDAMEKWGGHGRPWVAAGELVGSFARARKARSEAWKRWGMVWECSPLKWLNQDGLMEEIDDSGWPRSRRPIHYGSGGIDLAREAGRGELIWRGKPGTTRLRAGRPHQISGANGAEWRGRLRRAILSKLLEGSFSCFLYLFFYRYKMS